MLQEAIAWQLRFIARTCSTLLMQDNVRQAVLSALHQRLQQLLAKHASMQPSWLQQLWQRLARLWGGDPYQHSKAQVPA